MSIKEKKSTKQKEVKQEEVKPKEVKPKEVKQEEVIQEIPMYYNKAERIKKSKLETKREEYLSNYDKRPHIGVELGIRFTGFDGKPKDPRRFTEAEKEDYEKQFAFRGDEFEAEIREILKIVNKYNEEKNSKKVSHEERI
jgi:hypothetical protein